MRTSRTMWSRATVVSVTLACLGALLVSGASAASAQSDTCFGETPTIRAVPGRETVGTSGPDVIVGTSGSDIIRGGGGGDRICAGSGDDTIRGNDGADRIDAGSGDDVVIGGKGADIIRAGRGADTVFGNKGADDIRGQRGADTIHGGRGDDTINGNSGNDVCRGGAGTDTITNCEVTGAITSLLNVVFDDGVSPDTSVYWIVCRDDGSSELVGGTVSDVDAALACGDLTSDSATRTRLIEGAPAFEVCIDQDFGPEVAEVSGIVDGFLVSERVSRTNGCGETLWNQLNGSGILPTPSGPTLVGN